MSSDEKMLTTIRLKLSNSFFLLRKIIGPKTNRCQTTSLQGIPNQRLGTKLNSQKTTSLNFHSHHKGNAPTRGDNKIGMFTNNSGTTWSKLDCGSSTHIRVRLETLTSQAKLSQPRFEKLMNRLDYYFIKKNYNIKHLKKLLWGITLRKSYYTTYPIIQFFTLKNSYLFIIYPFKSPSLFTARLH